MKLRETLWVNALRCADMTRRDAVLLREIEEAAHDESKSLAGDLRKCIALGRSHGSPELRDWAAEELNGYNPAGDLPLYRKVQAPVLIDWISAAAQMGGQRIGVGDLPAVVAEEGCCPAVRRWATRGHGSAWRVCDVVHAWRSGDRPTDDPC